MILQGYAATFNTIATIAGTFHERLLPGAFASALRSGDVRALFNHDANYVLARQSAGTLRLSEDETGLRYEIDLGEDPVSEAIARMVKRKEVTGSSFSFVLNPADEEWGYVKGAPLPLRTIYRVQSVGDVGPVTFPAYEKTSVSVRSMPGAIRIVRVD